MPHNVRNHLRVEIEQYDAMIRRFIPGYETMLREAAREVAAGSPALVLDIGAGTGALSQALLEHPEVGAVELIDIDPEMLDLARKRLVAYGGRVRFVHRSYDEPFGWCDAIAASLSLHHIRTLEEKSALFARAYDALRPGGVLVNADANMPRDPRECERLYRDWASHLMASGIDEARAWQHFEEWSEEDTYLPLDEEMDALERVGFEARCVWSAGALGVVVARRRGDEPREPRRGDDG